MSTQHIPGAPSRFSRGDGPKPLDSRTPVLFMPVNIETRFMDSSEGGSQLYVRIYPDQIAINSHEPELTQQEITDGQTYWDAVWRAGNPPPSLDNIKAPWRGLASLYGPQRAGWIALQMTPTNVAQQPVAPTPPGQNPNPAPVYPQPAMRPSSFTKPAIADLLPDAWTVVTVSGSQTGTYRGGAITPGLAVGITPGAGAFPPGQPVDQGMKWLVDFDTAFSAGMAVKIPLTQQQRAAGFDRIFVYGVRTKNPNGGPDFAGLLDAHHYTDGISLVPQGAPTNNTPDASSAFSRKDPDYEISFAVERQGSLSRDTAADGNLFARLIGLDPASMAHVRYADSFYERNGTDALTALWPATLGYFLSQMMASVFSADQIESARQYALANAIPRGALPPFRVGRVPYGVLPVTSLMRYKPDDFFSGGSVEAGLVDFIRRLWPTWLASSTLAPHMQNGGDPDAQLVGLLGMDASSMTFRGRPSLGPQFMWNYLWFLGIPTPILNQWWVDYLVSGRQLLDSYNYAQWDPRVIHLAMSQNSFPVSFPTVQDGPLSETDPLKADANLGGGKNGNYIQWLRQASISDIQAENYPGPKPASLLYKILRQSLILLYADLAGSAEIGAGRLQAVQLREAEMVAIPQAPPPVPSLSTWELLARRSLPNPLMSWAQYLVSLNPSPQSPYARLNEVRASLDRLAVLPTAELDRLLTETLDACSHRLDVWATAIANALLQRTRSTQLAGVHLGCFGWVEEVRPKTAQPPVLGSELQQVRALDQFRSAKIKTAAVLPTPVQPASDNGGYIYAPSLAQAAVAAVLRNGYMTHKGTSEEGLLSVDLSSERARNALLLLDGVRQGQSLNALLGYLFEAALHDLQLDIYIQPFRDRFPVVANKLTPSSAPSISVAASNVVDGLAMRTAWDNGQLSAGQDWGPGLPAAGSQDQNTVLGLLKTLDDYADALGDLSLCEAIFQVMRGNFGRGGALLDAISQGARPPEPDVINTPRGGLDLTHRVALLFAGNPAGSADWAGVPNRPRATAEPWLDAWLSQVLPDPTTVACEVRYHNATGNHIVPVLLSDLNVGPLDCIAMADATETPQKSELEYRIVYAAAVPADADGVQISFQPAALPPLAIEFPDFFFLVKSLRSLIGSARALTPQDMTVPEKNAQTLGGAVDLGELRIRAGKAVQSIGADVTALQTAIAGLPGNPGPVRNALIRCSFYGVAGSVPYTSAGPDPGLADQANAVLKILQDRSAKASGVNLATAPLADLLSVFAAIFGDGFAALPRFAPPDFASLQGAFAQSAALTASDPSAPARWLTQLTHIRPAISRLDESLSLAMVLGGSSAAQQNLLLGQLPLVANDKWLALPIDPANPPDKGRVAFACLTQGDVANQNSYAGLLVDEWPERIPSTKENAAVAFHYGEPKARAPQSLLLAVCPDAREFWDDDLILGVLQETLELAKIRTVDLDSVQQVGQILPALYFALNLQGATISTNFAIAKEVISAPSILS